MTNLNLNWPPVGAERKYRAACAAAEAAGQDAPDWFSFLNQLAGGGFRPAPHSEIESDSLEQV